MSIILIDIQERDLAHRRVLLDEYERILAKNKWDQTFVVAAFGGINAWVAQPPDVYDLLSIVMKLYGDGPNATPTPLVVDPMLVAVRDDLGMPSSSLTWTASPEGDPKAQLLFASQHAAAAAAAPARPGPRVPALTAAERQFGAVAGILLRDRRTEPDDALRFRKALANARGEYGYVEKDLAELFRRSFELLVEESEHLPDQFVRAEHWAGIVDSVASEGIRGDDMYLPMHVRQALNGRAGDRGTGSGAPAHFPGAQQPSWIEIQLPDLEAAVDTEILSDNLKAMQCLYFASVLEEAKFFQVIDRVLEQFNMGVLPLGKGTAGDKLYKYYKRNFDRFTEIERRNLYSRAFGMPGGEAVQGNPNRGFVDLWLRFISCVSEYARQQHVDSLLKARNAVSLSQEQVRKSARDLAANLSLFGYGLAWFAATELQQQIKDGIDILNHEEIRGAYGARDLWQVIDQVATLDLGGARNSVRYRTMANSGAIIIRWLAERAEDLARPGRGRIFSDADLLDTSRNVTNRHNPLVTPTNIDLIDACEQYLAVTGTSDQRVEEFSQPVMSPDGPTSRPIQIPGMARDLLDSVGIAGISLN